LIATRRDNAKPGITQRRQAPVLVSLRASGL
jgi:hypothetical protein